MARAGIGEIIVTEGALIRNYPDLKAIPLIPEVRTNSLLAWKKCTLDEFYTGIHQRILQEE